MKVARFPICALLAVVVDIISVSFKTVASLLSHGAADRSNVNSTGIWKRNSSGVSKNFKKLFAGTAGKGRSIGCINFKNPMRGIHPHSPSSALAVPHSRSSTS